MRSTRFRVGGSALSRPGEEGARGSRCELPLGVEAGSSPPGVVSTAGRRTPALVDLAGGHRAHRGHGRALKAATPQEHGRQSTAEEHACNGRGHRRVVISNPVFRLMVRQTIIRSDRRSRERSKELGTMRKLLATVGYTVAAVAGLAVAALVTFSGQAQAATDCHLAVGAGRAFLTGTCPPTARVATYRYTDGAAPGDFFASFPQTLSTWESTERTFPTAPGRPTPSTRPSSPPRRSSTPPTTWSRVPRRPRGRRPPVPAADHDDHDPPTTATQPSTTVAPPVSVQPTEVDRVASPIGADVAGSELARTGTSRTGWYTTVAAGLILAGLTALAVSRRMANDALDGTRDA